MLVSTRNGVIYVLDSFDGTLRHQLSGIRNDERLNLEASFTPDGKFVASGSQDGTIHIWRVDTGERVTVLPRSHPVVPARVQFNPKYMTLATGCNLLVGHFVQYVLSFFYFYRRRTFLWL